LAAALFHNDYEGLQVPTTITGSAGNLQRVFINADESYSQGLELEAQWRATDRLEFIGVYSYMDTEIEDGPVVQDLVRGGFSPLTGNELPRAPDHRLTLNGSYTWPVAGGDLSLSGTYSYTGSQYFDVFSNPFYEEDGFSRVDLRGIYEGAGGRWRLIGSVRNATDEQAINNIFALPALSLSNPTPGQPNAGNLASLPADVTAIPAGTTLAGLSPDQGGARALKNFNEPRIFTLELQLRF